MTERVGFIQRGQAELSYFALLPETSKTILVIVHGLSEHKGRYARLQNDLARAGFGSYAYDQRGFGQSNGVRTHVERYTDFFLDLKEVIRFIRAEHPGLKVVIVAHSLGGAVAASFCIDNPHEADGLVLSAPAYDVPPLPLQLQLLGYLLNPFFPMRSIRYESNPEKFSHDPQIGIAFKSDPLVQSAGTPRFYIEFRKMNDRLHRFAHKIVIPTLILQGSDDGIVIPQGARSLYERIGSSDKKLHWYDGFYHEVFNEVGRERVIADLIAWLKEHFI
jgi:acylglycerol lipase